MLPVDYTGNNKTSINFQNFNKKCDTNVHLIDKDRMMGLFDFLKKKKKMYTGGDGGSLETAVIINETSMVVGIPAEYEFVISKCGQKDVDWTLECQVVKRSGLRKYDLIEVKLKDGHKKTFYFDITQFYGKF